MIKSLLFSMGLAILLPGCYGGFDHKHYVIGEAERPTFYLDEVSQAVAQKDLNDGGEGSHP